MRNIRERKYPKRDQNSVLESESERYFRGILPIEWLVDKPNDYGIDLIVTPVLSESVIGLNFSVQLKAKNNVNKKWEVRLKKTTLNYLFNRLEPVMIVLYDKTSDTAKWKWLLQTDFDLTSNVSTYLIRFNEQQILSDTIWVTVCDFVQRVFKVKNQLLTSLEYNLFNTQSELEVKAWAHYISGNYEETVFYLKRIIQEQGDKAIWYFTLAQCQYLLFDYRNAIININKASDLRTDDTILLTKSCILAEDGIRTNDFYKLVEAEKIFLDLYTRVPNAIHAYNLANTVSKFNKLKEAEKLYKFALKKNPNYAEAWKNLGQLYYDLRKHDQEIKCYNKALAINPNLFQASVSKAITNGFIYRQYKNSLKIIYTVIQKEPRIFVDFPVIYYWVGYFNFKINNTERALEWINAGLSNNPGDKLLTNLKATLFSEVIENNTSLLSEAIDFFSSNYKLNEQDPVNFYCLCKCKEKQSGEEVAYEMLLNWLKTRPYTIAFQNISKNQLPFEDAIMFVKYWGYIQSYYHQYPIEKIEFEMEQTELSSITEFLWSFELKRFVLISNLIELLNSSSSERNIKKGVSALFRNSLLAIPVERVCKMITAPQTDLSTFTRQFAEVLVTMSNLYLIEVSRCVGHIVGVRNNESEKKMRLNIVDPSLYQVTFLFYTEAVYNHFGLP